MIDMDTFNSTMSHLAAPPSDEKTQLEANIGRKVRFNVPSGGIEREQYLLRNGTASLALFEVVGVQKIYDGSLAYRVKCLEYNDQIGRPLRPSEAVFDKSEMH